MARVQSNSPMIWSQFSTWMLQAQWSRLGATLVLLAFGTAGSHVAVGQDADVEALLERGRKAGVNTEQMKMVAKRARRAGLSSEATASLLRPAAVLAEQDLPAGPLLSKTLEGLAKRVPPARMQPVLQQYRIHTKQAGRLVNQWTQRSDVQTLLGTSEAPPGKTQKKAHAQLVTAATEAQQQDVPTKDIEAFLNGLPNGIERRPVSLDQVATAVGVLPDLPGNGTSLETARQLLTSALSAGYSPESLRQLPSALKSAHQKSKRPVDVLAQGAVQAIAKGTPAATVLQNLFQGALPGGGPPAGTRPPGNAPGPGKQPGTGPPDDTGPPGDPTRDGGRP